MKAVIIKQFGAPEQMSIGDWETPTPNKNEILVKVKATALNRADILQRKGGYAPPKGASPILGLEMAGEVAAIGKNVTDWKIGDRVCGLLTGGGYAEYVVIHEKVALPIPQNLTFEEAAAIPEVFLTAFQAMHWLGDLQENDKVLIHAGASGVGTAAIQLAKLKNAEIFVTASKGKHAICAALGAHHTIDYKTENFETVIAEKTNGQGVNIIVDFLAAPYFQQNINSINFDGKMIMLALMGGLKAQEINLLNILRKRIHIKGSTLRARTLDYKIKLTQDLKASIWNKFETRELKPVIDSLMDWTEVAAAHHYMEANKNAGKIVLRIV
jgi:putative PIG3 family NAD(P)H quinone oxidoreductase